MIRKAVEWLFSKDEYTWIGHGVWGIVFGLAFGWLGWLPALMFVLGAFTFREFSDAIEHIWIKKDRTVESTLRDGWGDWIGPLIGYVIGMLPYIL